MVYVMNSGHPIATPSHYYLDTIRVGYHEARFDHGVLDEAVKYSTAMSRTAKTILEENEEVNGYEEA